MTRILIIDDHAIVRRGLRLVLEAQPGLEVIAEAGSMPDAVELVQQWMPDIVTLDLSLPGPDGVSSIKRIKQVAPSCRVIVVSMHDDAAYVRSALALGAMGFVSKSAGDGVLVNAVRTAMRGVVFIDPGLEDVTEHEQALHRQNLPDSPASQLTERELEVLTAVAQGYSNQQIADQLCLSVKTVETYRARLMQKLLLKDRADLVRLAIGMGLLNGPGD